jgi:NAD(P)-dependent dehydrogenase (short-subunit alcohol dehydrogenase family)
MTFAKDLDFTGKRVLVTGAANGFGAAMCELFGAHGADLVMADIEKAPLEALAARLGGQAHLFDQSDANSIATLGKAVGNVDVLVNNAGILIAKPLLQTDTADIRRLVDVDFVGVALLMREFGAKMVARRGGVIVNLSSQTAFSGGENRGVYAATKAAVAQLTRAAAVEWGPSGVRVVALAPGRSLTRMTRATTAAPDYKGDRGLARVPLGRWGEVEEIAKLIVFLASDAAGYVTGTTLVADGGFVVG